MRLAAAISRLVDRVNGSVPDPALHFELVRALYGATSTAKPLFIATAAAAAVTAIAAILSGDSVFAFIAAGFVLIGVARSIAASFYHRVEHDPEDVSALKRWELVALLGAWAFSAMVGVAGAYAVMFHPGTDVEILVGCCAIGYIAGVSSRNASRPLITIGQVSFTCVPFTAALLLRADVAHFVLEPISKLPEQDEQASELDEAEKVLRVELPADQQASTPLDPGEEAFDQPAASIPAKLAAVLGGRLHTV